MHQLFTGSSTFSKVFIRFLVFTWTNVIFFRREKLTKNHLINLNFVIKVDTQDKYELTLILRSSLTTDIESLPFSADYTIPLIENTLSPGVDMPGNQIPNQFENILKLDVAL